MGTRRGRCCWPHLSAPRAARHLHRAADRARLFLRGGDLGRDDRLQRRHRQADLHVRRERRLRLHVRRDRQRRRGRVPGRPRAAGGHARHACAGTSRPRERRRPMTTQRADQASASMRRSVVCRASLVVVAWEAAARLHLVPPLFLPPFSRSWCSLAPASPTARCRPISASAWTGLLRPRARDASSASCSASRWRAACAVTGCSIRWSRSAFPRRRSRSSRCSFSGSASTACRRSCWWLSPASFRS